jgi:hypothetical protein
VPLCCPAATQRRKNASCYRPFDLGRGDWYSCPNAGLASVGSIGPLRAPSLSQLAASSANAAEPPLPSDRKRQDSTILSSTNTTRPGRLRFVAASAAPIVLGMFLDPCGCWPGISLHASLTSGDGSRPAA